MMPRRQRKKFLEVWDGDHHLSQKSITHFDANRVEVGSPLVTTLPMIALKENHSFCTLLSSLPIVLKEELGLLLFITLPNL